MKSPLLQKLKDKQFEQTVRTKEYQQLLGELAEQISESASTAANEATVVSGFEIDLFGFIKDTLGLRYKPEKEKLVSTVRHVSKGRIDSKIGALVIEFKHPGKLKAEKDVIAASSQLREYIEGLQAKSLSEYVGIVTDGTKAKFIVASAGTVSEGALTKLNSTHLDRIIKSIVLLEKIALTPKNLVRDFCEPGNASLTSRITKKLFLVLQGSPTPRSLMLFNEWKELFRLAHDDKSKQSAIEERRQSLESVIGLKLKNTDTEYLALYALQTTYAIIVKIIAYKVISKIRFNKSLISFNDLSSADSSELQIQMSSLEEGAIFRSLGIGNLLEGDFFAWYCIDSQWTDEIAELIQEVFAILTQYEDKAVFETGDNVEDLFRDLFMSTIPDKVRHSLGEFYTPPWLADQLVGSTLRLRQGENKSWKALDPCSGSGTFVTALIRRVLSETATQPKEKRLAAVLSRVKAIDLNPLAVLTTRINYFINISPLISDADTFEIPVYLGDASYVPQKSRIGKVKTLKYSIKTIKSTIEINLPTSAVSDPDRFSSTMTSIEDDIVNLDAVQVRTKILELVPKSEQTPEIAASIDGLANQFIELERNAWNGIWARILTNFLTTANLGEFDLIVGNPPWIDWKNLPAGYRDRIKDLCIDRHLFSGDGVTGGINLNVCALIANVSAQNWLAPRGVLSFLMPQSLIFQQSYEGFRDFQLDGNKRLYFQELFDWTEAGHPFKPVQHKFLTFFLSDKYKSYSNGIPRKVFVKAKRVKLSDFDHCVTFDQLAGVFTERNELAGQANPDNTIFSCATDAAELESFKRISGSCAYKGREGVEFYPQELYLLEVDKEMPMSGDKVFVKNIQVKKSKYRVPPTTFPLEKRYLQPLVKGVDIERFHLRTSNLVAPFAYEPTDTRSPIPIAELFRKSKLLAQYFNRFKGLIESQTDYNERIIGKQNNTEFYSLARVGDYSFASNYVVFRDNTKWQAVVVTSIKTPWGEIKRPQFQNHAVSICQDEKGNFIGLDEAHYICAVLNAPIAENFILKSSDSRSFKIRPQINVPKFNRLDPMHIELCELSKAAHANHDNKSRMHSIDQKLNELVVQLRKN